MAGQISRFFFVFCKHKEIAIDMCDLLLDFCVDLRFCLKFSGRNIHAVLTFGGSCSSPAVTASIRCLCGRFL